MAAASKALRAQPCASDSSHEVGVRGRAASAAAGDVYGDLVSREVHALDAWSRHRRDRQQVLTASVGSREQRLDAARSLAALDRAHASLVAQLDQMLKAAGDSPLRSQMSPRAVLVHRQEWFVEQLTEALSNRSVVVVAACDNGADAVGILIAEQPDLVAIEESLPMVSGVGVLAAARRFCPQSAVAAQVASGEGVGKFLDAGARLAVTRQISPEDLAARMSGLLAQRS